MKKRMMILRAVTLLSTAALLGACGKKDAESGKDPEAENVSEEDGAEDAGEKDEKAGDGKDSGKENGENNGKDSGKDKDKDTDKDKDKETDKDGEGKVSSGKDKESGSKPGASGDDDAEIELDDPDDEWDDEDWEEEEDDDDERFAGRSDASAGIGTPKELHEGDVAPDFSIETNYGDTFTLSDFDSDVVLINFWATWCGPCVGEMPAIERLEEDGDAFIIGINCGEDRDTIDDFIDENEFTYYIGYDDDGAVSTYYPSQYIPYTLVINQGIIYKIFVGVPGGSEEAAYQEYYKAIQECL